MADSTSQRGRETESDIAVDLCPNFSQTANYSSQNDREITPDGDRSSPRFWNNVPPSTRDKLSNIYLEVVLWKPKFTRLKNFKSSNAFGESPDEALRPLADDTSQTSCAMTAATFRVSVVESPWRFTDACGRLYQSEGQGNRIWHSGGPMSKFFSNGKLLFPKRQRNHSWRRQIKPQVLE